MIYSTDIYFDTVSCILLVIIIINFAARLNKV